MKLSFNALMQPQQQEIILPLRIRRKRSKIESIGSLRTRSIIELMQRLTKLTTTTSLAGHVRVFFYMLASVYLCGDIFRSL